MCPRVIEYSIIVVPHNNKDEIIIPKSICPVMPLVSLSCKMKEQILKQMDRKLSRYMRKERSVDTEVSFGRGDFGFATTFRDWTGDLVTFLWLSRPERGGRRGLGVSIGTDRQTKGGLTNGQIWHLKGSIQAS